ncbi:MAG: hypothetical protein M3072_17480 [Candidatus Dormibacteraeota bacterium]|nr:hypothetical protein [Candidatus Dormibacteraeota bacterium]
MSRRWTAELVGCYRRLLALQGQIARVEKTAPPLITSQSHQEFREAMEKILSLIEMLGGREQVAQLRQEASSHELGEDS